jgi:di/tricarboxylate transporter
MRALALLVFDVLMALVLFVAGTGSISLSGQPWLAPIGLLPCALWLKWRIPLHDLSSWGIIACCFGFALYFVAWEHLTRISHHVFSRAGFWDKDREIRRVNADASG